MHRSSHTAGLLHALCCSSNVQVSPSHLAFYFFLFSLSGSYLSNMPSSPRPVVLSCGVLSRLRRMDPGAAPAQYSQLLDCMCSWGHAADILELVTDWLAEALPKPGVSQYNIRFDMKG